LIATNSNSSDTLVLNNYITVYPFPPPQGILQNGDTLFSNGGAVSYQWFHNGNLIPGATDYFYIAPESGNYNVVATDANGCEVEAVIFDVIASVSTSDKLPSILLYPNPVTGILHLQIHSSGKHDYACRIVDVIGNSIVNFNYDSRATQEGMEVDLSLLSKGMYWLETFSEEGIQRMKFIKQ
jgi:hypothetical protein